VTAPRLMPDGINSLAAGIARAFPGAALVAGYVDGDYAWSQADWGLFPGADHVLVSVRAADGVGDVLDVENGDATPEQTAGWITARKAAGLYRPTVYCDLETVPAVRAGTGSYILGVDYDIWVASYDGSQDAPGVPGLPPAEFAAKQYESTAGWDLSAVYDDGWPHRKAPAPPLLPAPKGTSASPWLFIDLSCAEVDGATGYSFEVRQGGTVREYSGTGTSCRTGNLKPGSYEWRVSADGGEWTEWTAV
jgi:hypothetical protein